VEKKMQPMQTIGAMFNSTGNNNQMVQCNQFNVNQINIYYILDMENGRHAEEEFQQAERDRLGCLRTLFNCLHVIWKCVVGFFISLFA
jgi:hypothetical protein